MKSSLLIVSVLIFFAGNIFSQNVNKTVHDEKIDKDILVDYIDSTGLYDGMFGLYYKTQFDTYSPKSKYIKKSKAFIEKGDYEFITVLGDWCSDSKLQVGRFDKVLKELEIPKNKIKHIGVDRDKKAREVNIKNYKILRVPTFIVMLNGIEIGRITESPDASLEKDLYDILKEN
ncbi:MAG: hypothetical protein C0598_08960 [Marinilabiliales bacterium]|nr:MAG: hypothetical protein C0598_08960 [Marinilabiliales bacterium]